MKLFGNQKRQRTPAARPEEETPQNEPIVQEHAPSREPTDFAVPAPQPKAKTNKKSGQGKQDHTSAKSMAVLLAALALFVTTALMCFYLIEKSGQPYELPEQLSNNAKVDYVVNSQPSTLETVKEKDPDAPTGVNNSVILNTLLVSLDETSYRTESVMLMSVNLDDYSVSLVSLPRDTYISGNYENSTINDIYREKDDGKGRGIRALQEAVEGMVGFKIDYHYVVTQETLTNALDAIDGLRFRVPRLDFCALDSGTRKMDGEDAIQLFTYDPDYYDIDLEGPDTQRKFLLSLMSELIATNDEGEMKSRAQAVLNNAETNVDEDTLLYFFKKLTRKSFDDAYSVTMPGEIISLGEDEGLDYTVEYYQVSQEDAVSVLNEYFNPLEKALTVFNINFRQKSGLSTDGEYQEYGFHNQNSGSHNGGSTTKPTTEATTAEPTSPAPTDAPVEDP
ncbi:MAG: LCP family protein [Candidatus Faecousia sp.]|uniref:LCP family protein n=1 Tax=Faecousia sp. TaxID=2952921 RepID=UPI002A846924|nr:LCP family protein [Candidatus Faecousia sp.]